MKKAVLSLFVVALLLVIIPATSAFAHRGNGNGHRSSTSGNYTACSVDGCTKTGVHSHSGTQNFCTLENCVNQTQHQYNSENCRTASGTAGCAHTNSFKQHCR